MNRLEDMQIFVEVIHRGNFSEAAKHLKVSKQFVSRRVNELEARLGVRLLNRTTRKVSPTSLGLSYFEAACDLLQAANETEHEISSHRAQIKGRLRLTAPLHLGLHILPNVIASFIERYPDVHIQLDLSDRIIDLVDEGYDLALRIADDLTDSSLIRRKLAHVRKLTVASPSYLAVHGTPTRLDDLAQHKCLLYGQSRQVQWVYHSLHQKTQMINVSGDLNANNGDFLCALASLGLGIVQLPEFMVLNALKEGSLVTLLDEFEPELGMLNAIYPSHRQVHSVVRAFIDYLVEVLPTYMSKCQSHFSE